MKKNFLKKLLPLICLIIFTSGCAKKQERYQTSFLELFDTVTTLSGYADSEESFTVYGKSLKENLRHYHELYDIYNDYPGINNIKTINDNAGAGPVKVDRDIIELLKFARDMSALTEGKVNICCGSVFHIWHEERERGIDNPEEARLPDMEELKEASLHTSPENLVIDEENGTVFLKDAGMRLDVGAVAKGYAAQRAVEKLKAEGLENFVLSVGGNVYASGHKFAESGDMTEWVVGIQNPDSRSEQTSVYNLKLSDSALVTSGIYERYYTVDGEIYHHIINPDTLMPSREYDSVSIVCPDSGMADALSTAVFNMSYEEGSSLIDRLENVEAMWLYPDGSMKFSRGFEGLKKN